MRIAFLESFYGGSHRQFADGLLAHSLHDWGLFHLPDRHWKWRMHDAAAALARQLLKSSFKPDLVLATSLMDVAALRGYLHQAGWAVPVVTYFHENQLAYPFSPNDKDAQRGIDNHYAYVNYTTALASDHVVFNSTYNRDSFLSQLPAFLQQFPDGYRGEDLEKLREKSSVIPVGVEVKQVMDGKQARPTALPLVIWNHRWAHDKHPELFFETLETLSREHIPFELAVLGPSRGRAPEVFESARNTLSKHVVHWGTVPSRQDYINWLHRAHVLPVTSRQDFFGISVVEGIACGAWPILPNRMAFPAHLPDAPVYWNSPQELLELTRKALTTSSPPPKEWSQNMLRYDWSVVAPQIDEFLATCKS